MRTAVFGFFFLSGASGLLYQVAWIRTAGTVMGNTTHAIGTVVGVFMGGLALGAWLGGRAADRRSGARLLSLYGKLEAAIAGTALLVPLLLSGSEPLYRGLWGALENAPVVYGLLRALLVAVVLIVPTTLMGATLPVLARYFSSSPETADRDAGRAYAVNTLGAVAGTLAAGFWLVPDLGLRATTLLAAAINLAIGAASILLARGKEGGDAPPAAAPPPLPRLALAVAALSGFTSLVYEVAWTRSLVLSLGSTVYAFTLTLTVFILGLALGSAAVTLFRARANGLMLAALQLAIGVVALVLVPRLGDLPLDLAPKLEGVRKDFGSLLRTQAWVIGSSILLPTFLMGAVFPVTCRLALEGGSGVGRSVGGVYTANTLGCIAGSVGASFLFIPLLGLSGAIVGAAAMNFALSAYLLFREPRARLLAAVPAVAIAVGFLLPRWDPKVMASGAFLYGSADARSAQREGQDLRTYLDEDSKLLGQYWDSYGLVTVHELRNGTLTMRVNGKTDASTGPSDRANMAFVGHLPMLHHPAPKRAMLIGLGAGLTLKAMASHPVDRVDCVDISSAVVRAADQFREATGDVLHRPNVRIVVGDGRNALRFGREPYDVIVSQPSNLWISGMANLFTREFFREAGARLAPGGVFGQWVHAYWLSTADLQEVIRTFSEVFPHGSVWEIFPGSDYILLGTNGPARLPLAGLEARLAKTGALAEYLDAPLAPSLLGHLIADNASIRALVGEGPVTTDDLCAIEYRAPRSLHRDSRPETLRWFEAARNNRAETLLYDGAEGVSARRDRRKAVAEAVKLFAEEQPVLAMKTLPRDASDPRTKVFIDHVSDALLALAYRRLDASRDPSGAAEAFLLVPPSSARHSEAQVQLGGLALEARDLEAARRSFRIARESDPKSFGAAVGLAQIHEARREFEPALDLWREAVALRPDSVPARFQLAFCLSRLGRTEEARTECRRVLELDPGNARASRLLADLGR
jgi:spermidine synthase